MSENPHGILTVKITGKASVDRCGDSGTHRHVCIYNTNMKCSYMRTIYTNVL